MFRIKTCLGQDPKKTHTDINRWNSGLPGQPGTIVLITVLESP